MNDQLLIKWRLPKIDSQQPKFDYVCQTCGKMYKLKRNLLRHSRYECGKNPRFQCPYCSSKAKQRTGIYSHIKHVHPGQKIYLLDLGPEN